MHPSRLYASACIPQQRDVSPLLASDESRRRLPRDVEAVVRRKRDGQQALLWQRLTHQHSRALEDPKGMGSTEHRGPNGQRMGGYGEGKVQLDPKALQ
jgi:hypothetical protein